MNRPRNVREWLDVLGGEYADPQRDFDERIRLALERLHLGLVRERAAWVVLLGNHGLGRTVRDVKKALSGNVVWPEATPAPAAE